MNSSSILASSYDSEAQQMFKGKKEEHEEIKNQSDKPAAEKEIEKAKIQVVVPQKSMLDLKNMMNKKKDSFSSGSCSLDSDSLSDDSSENSIPSDLKGIIENESNSISDNSGSNSMVIPFSPILKRNDIAGKDEELSGIEEFYLAEIEQIQNTDLMSKL